MPRSKAAVKKASEKVHEKKKLTSQKIARKSAPVETGVKKRRAKAGRVALKEIKKYQKQTKPMLQRAPFQRKIKKMLLEMDFETLFRFQSNALHALQEATEAAVVSLFQDANLCCMHAGRVTVMHKDILLARKIRGERF